MNFLLIGLICLANLSVDAQVLRRVCKSHINHLKMMDQDPRYANKRAALELLNIHDSSRNSSNRAEKKSTSLTIYQIPVVVHVIHNGEPEGTNPNISQEQIHSAISALNQDFRSLNVDTLLPSHPFYSLQADVGFEFALAKLDTNDQATSGIMRYQKGQDGWETDNFDQQVKPNTIWDINEYLNIWVTTFSGFDESTLGYATFPGSTLLDQVGVVVGAQYFGTSGGAIDPNFNKNRTLTHEIGHFFNLHHIWGDETCGDDLVNDTPAQEGPNDSNCPSFPHNTSSSCNPGNDGEMFMNYMDYTLDECMQLFTIGQKERMRAAILLSDRVGLTTSGALSTSTNNRLINDEIILYPNPAKHTAIVTGLPTAFQLMSVRVLELNGKPVHAKVSLENSQISIQISGLASGTYYVSLRGKKETLTKKLIIIK